MEQIRRKLVESGLIPRILYDFIPRMEIILYCGHKRINIGDEATIDEVQSPTIYVQHGSARSDVELHETSRQPCLVASVMTDPDAPGGEYLHLLSVQYISAGKNLGVRPTVLFAYEPPRWGVRMLVFTWFKVHAFLPIARPNSRRNFSTRVFAHTHALGAPLGATFFNIKYENKKQKQKELSTSVTAQKEVVVKQEFLYENEKEKQKELSTSITAQKEAVVKQQFAVVNQEILYENEKKKQKDEGIEYENEKAKQKELSTSITAQKEAVVKQEILYENEKEKQKDEGIKYENEKQKQKELSTSITAQKEAVVKQQFAIVKQEILYENEKERQKDEGSEPSTSTSIAAQTKNIKYENEKEKRKDEGSELSTSITAQKEVVVKQEVL